MKPWLLLKALWEAGAERIWVDENGQVRVLWSDKTPSAIKVTFLEGRLALAEWLISQKKQDIRYIWSTTLRDLIAIAKTEKAASYTPSDIVCYIGIEIKELENVEGTENLRLIHQAKKLFGGRVKRQELAAIAV